MKVLSATLLMSYQTFAFSSPWRESAKWLATVKLSCVQRIVKESEAVPGVGLESLDVKVAIGFREFNMKLYHGYKHALHFEQAAFNTTEYLDLVAFSTTCYPRFETFAT